MLGLNINAKIQRIIKHKWKRTASHWLQMAQKAREYKETPNFQQCMQRAE